MWPEDLADEDEYHVESNTAYLSKVMLKKLVGDEKPELDPDAGQHKSEIQLRREAHLNRLNPERKGKRGD